MAANYRGNWQQVVLSWQLYLNNRVSMSQQQAISDLLEQLIDELKQSNLWSEVAPKPEALLSTQPFAIDTLTFEQWLQFIFLPKMTLLIENGQPLPDKIALTPMAEQVYQSTGKDFSSLLGVLQNIDSSLTK